MANQKASREYQAVTNLSLSRPRTGNTQLEAGARLVRRGQKITFGDEYADADVQIERLLAKGFIRPWADKDKPMVRLTARDISGREFPDSPKLVATAQDSARLNSQPTADGDAAALAPPEMKDPQPIDQGPENAPPPPPAAPAPAAPATDPYAK